MKLFSSLILSASVVASVSAQIDTDVLTTACDDVITWVQNNIDNTDWLDPETTGDGAYERTEDPKNWVQGAFFVGMKDYAIRTQTEAYFSWMKEYAEASGVEYGMGSRSYDAEFADIVSYSADDQVVGQYYIALANYYSDAADAAIGPLTERLDAILADPSDVELDHSISMEDYDTVLYDFGYDYKCQPRWCWADSLYMGPVTWFDLYTYTGDAKYAEFAHDEILATYEYLFTDFENPNTENPNIDSAFFPEGVPGGLFIRDSRYLTEADRKEEDGSYIYWARGNGWVFSSLTNILKNLAADDEHRPFYEGIFTQMAKALVYLQRPAGDAYEGLWGPSLVNWDEHPVGESSGTAFYISGFAYGLTNGLLDVETYGAATLMGWNALLNVQITADDGFDGKVGAIGQQQMIGADPDDVFEDGVQLYGCGGFLQAAANILDMLDAGIVLDGSSTPTSASAPEDATPTPASPTPASAPEDATPTPATPTPASPTPASAPEDSDSAPAPSPDEDEELNMRSVAPTPAEEEDNEEKGGDCFECDELLFGVDIIGHNIDDSKLQVDTEKECSDACSDLDDCNAWTVYKGWCYPKEVDDETELEEKKGRTSWIYC